MIKEYKDFNAEENDNIDQKFFIIPNGNNEYDTISDYFEKIPDEGLREESTIKNHNPIKDLEVNDSEFNNKTIGKKMNTSGQSEESEEKIFSLDKIILNTFSSEEKVQDLQKINKINPLKLYFKEYNSILRSFFTEYANNLLRKHLLCGKIQEPRISLIKFDPKKKKKGKKKSLSFTMKKMFCFHKRKNKKIIKRILSFIKKFDCNNKYVYIKSFLSLKIGEAIQIFEESEKFKEFISDTKIISLDKEIKLQTGFSILEKNVYEKMIRMHCGV